MKEFFTVPWQKAHVAEGLSLRETGLVEPLAVGFHSVSRGRVRAATKWPSSVAARSGWGLLPLRPARVRA